MNSYYCQLLSWFYSRDPQSARPVSQALCGLPSKSQQPKFTSTITSCFPIKYTALIYLVDKRIQGQ